MKLLERIWIWLTTATARKPKKGHPDLYPINIDAITHELRLVEEAKRLGEAGLPTTDAVALSGPEAGVVQKVEKARQDYVDWAVLRLNILSQDLGRRNVTQDINRASQADKEFERTASARLAERENLLSTLGNSANILKAELQVFKAQHGLTREANNPKMGTALRYGILLLLIVLEGFLNASFFSQGMNSGLLGGFTMAAALASINVLIAFICGKFFIRYVNHSRTSLKICGLVAVAISTSIILTMGLSIAHYRDALTGDIVNPARAALEAILTNTFQLQDVFSWALFAISITFGFASLADGLFSDDLYPGYGDYARRTQMAIDDYDDELNELRNELEDLKNNELKALDKVVQQSQASTATFESLIDDKRMAASRLSTALRDADNSLEALLRKFRTENELHRKGLQRPDYFDRTPDLRPIVVPDFNTSADEAALSEQRELVDSLLSGVEEIRARIQAAFNHQFDRLKPLGTHFLDKVAQ